MCVCVMYDVEVLDSWLQWLKINWTKYNSVYTHFHTLTIKGKAIGKEICQLITRPYFIHEYMN